VDYRALQHFFKWADEIEEEITPNPMVQMRPPSVPESETPVLRPEEIKALRKACDGRDFMAGLATVSAAHCSRQLFGRCATLAV
jgi:site-specific recombinase XerD